MIQFPSPLAFERRDIFCPVWYRIRLREEYEESSNFLDRFPHLLTSYGINESRFERHRACSYTIVSMCIVMTQIGAPGDSSAGPNSIVPHGPAALLVQIQRRRPMERRKFLDLVGSAAASAAHCLIAF